VTAVSREIAIGDTAEPWSVGPVDVADFVRYAGASGDFNRLHYDELYARSAGFPSVFAQGMFQGGVLAGYAAAWLGPRAARRFWMRFVDVVYPGDTLTCTGEVVDKYFEDGEQRITVDLRCRRQTGDVVVQAAATFVVEESR
jgi:acyl dehydratase